MIMACAFCETATNTTSSPFLPHPHPPHQHILRSSDAAESIKEAPYLAALAPAPLHSRPDSRSATTIVAADEDIQEGQLVVFLLPLHRKLNVPEDGVEMLLECQHLIPFDDDEGVIHIPSSEFRSVMSENQRLQPL
ncbi:hypothetical protein SprV_0501738600 [Sparganum proliferum]